MFKVYRFGGKSLFLPLLLILPLIFFLGLPLLIVGVLGGLISLVFLKKPKLVFRRESYKTKNVVSSHGEDNVIEISEYRKIN